MESTPNASESLTLSPFEIPHEDVEALCTSEGFQVLRRCLAKDLDFCTEHQTCDKQAQDKWLLHRDLLHALVMPVVELFHHAEALAEVALCIPRPEDLELAFRGEARGAFLWMQCFISEEEDWCRTRGCPACVTMATMSTESHIRLTIAASLLSTASISSPHSSPATSGNSSPAESPTSPISPTDTETEAPSPRLSLPPLPQVLPALREALASDPFWGPDYWPYLFSRSTQLSAGIQCLIAECISLESTVPSSTDSTPAPKRNVTMPSFLRSASDGQCKQEEKGTKLWKSKMAKHQLRMKGEEMDIMRRCALQCWAAAAVPSKLRNEILGKGEKRVRSLTCP
ncbi:uncharacterized protein BDR25DRAFT_340254 [Lindgomyces ingoldianus]|uniref:Uncharacterized protein n=1 Tax=Lindgomyces ingoldianus TaxID=673940 RepID=A0ACB6R889_9PLEO|nr:uncharacterized protein BDR25DRAFT_340254 [Lindgomyces ingoldianus]KAF2475534.1 hypothetical protein BDR25DRAFT_340254 [Lindgomyces ingoldianus]